MTNEIAIALGRCERTRTLFATWFNTGQSVRTKINLTQFLKLDFLFQIGVFQMFCQEHNILVCAYVRSYDLIVIHPELLPSNFDVKKLEHNPVHNDGTIYVEYSKFVHSPLHEDIYKAAFKAAFAFLNVIKMEKIPY